MQIFKRKTADRIVYVLSAVLISGSFAITPGFASYKVTQDEANQEEAKKKAKKEKKNQESSRSVYKRWLNEDVAWIIMDEERKAFNMLKTDEERENFIEQFWLRRDPDPDTDANEYREEYYQRIAYANEKYTSGIPGWKTDRGRMYIMFGKPDQIESHPSGGTYDRPTWEGGGTTSTYPFETWWYRYIEGVGSDVEIEFVDPSGSGEYRIARSPYEKDALLYTPNAGLTLSEQLGLSSKADRIAYGMFGNGQGSNGQMFGMRAKDQPFEKLDLLSKIQRAPKVRFNDLAGIANESEMPKFSADVLTAFLNINKLRVTDTAILTSITVQLDNSDLVYKEVGGLQQATANIYAKITNVAGRRMGQFEKVVSRSVVPEGLDNERKINSSFQQNIILAPGTYKIDVVVRDVNGGKTGVMRHGFKVPAYNDTDLSSSTMILAAKIEPLNGMLATGQFVLGSLKVIPNATAVFTQDQVMGVYMQVYNVQTDQATLKPSVDVEYVISQNNKEVARIKEDSKSGYSSINTQQAMLARLIPLKSFKPGFYDIRVEVKDNVANKTLITDTDTFQIK